MMMMKKLIAGAAVVATLVGSVTPALAAPTPTTEAGVPLSAPITTPEEQAQTTATDDEATDATATGDEVAADELAEAGLTPDQFFYFLKIWIEKAHVALTRDAADQASVLEEQAEIRLAEAVAMAEAGKTDLAEKALNEAQAKLIEAARAIEKAEETGDDLTRLAEQIAADQAKYAEAVEKLLGELPEEVREELESATADLLIEVAVTQDAADPDETVEEEAEEVAEEAGLAEELSTLEPRKVLVLKAMAELSGEDLADIYDRYLQNPGLGRIAKELGLKMGAVQHTAQAEWKLFKAGIELGEELDAEAPVVDEDTDDADDADVDDGDARDDDRDDDDDDRDDDRDDDDDDADDDGDDEDDDDVKAGKANGKSNGKAKGGEKVSKSDNGKAVGQNKR